LATVTTVTALIEALVGLACVAMAWPCWQRRTFLFRAIAAILALAGITAVGNALIELLDA
jgi:putative effector of murein hydrolase